jgi:hypothetical protein
MAEQMLSWRLDPVKGKHAAAGRSAGEEDGFHEQAVVLGRDANMVLLPGRKPWFTPLLAT